MCYNYNNKIIVMICNITENSREKCANYWEANLEKYKIVNHKKNNLDVGLIKRTFKMQNLQEKKSKIIVQIQLNT